MIPQPIGIERNATLLADALGEQQNLGAAESFALAHERGDIAAGAARYRGLMPAAPPHPGQQYAFEVDLDRCTGCKACVTGCHNRNGLDPGETWRSVGLLLGGDDAQPLLRHVTAACHHCLDPACLSGCPVRAYEKDRHTGIVRHLDDQCIGCQYCVMKCPYGVPQYNAARGIVRKCDMCTDRLAAGEAPACVQSCPSDAIRITVVDTDLTAATCSERFAAVPGAPDASYTRPTTAYVSRSHAAPTAIAVAAAPAESHPSLVVMLSLTQAAIGILGLAAVLPIGDAHGTAISLGLGSAVAGMVAALFHLGRPQWAFRAVLGLRTSWLSREIVALSAFAGLAAAAALAHALQIGGDRGLVALTGATGIAAAFASAMVYRDTPRDHWARTATPARFFLAAAASGAVLLLLAHRLSGEEIRPLLVGVATAAVVAKILFEVWDGWRQAPSTARQLLGGALRPWWHMRLAAAAACAVLLGATALIAQPTMTTVLACALWLAGDGVDRHLFFRAAVAPRNP